MSMLSWYFVGVRWIDVFVDQRGLVCRLRRVSGSIDTLFLPLNLSDKDKSREVIASIKG